MSFRSGSVVPVTCPIQPIFPGTAVDEEALDGGTGKFSPATAVGAGTVLTS